MPRIELKGQLLLSSELYSRLRARGLITADLQCTDDLLLYIQECLARDDGRIPYVTGFDGRNTNTVSSKPVIIDIDRDESKQISIEDKDCKEDQKSNVSVDIIKNRLDVLYKMGG